MIYSMETREMCIYTWSWSWKKITMGLECRRHVLTGSFLTHARVLVLNIVCFDTFWILIAYDEWKITRMFLNFIEWHVLILNLKLCDYIPYLRLFEGRALNWIGAFNRAGTFIRVFIIYSFIFELVVTHWFLMCLCLRQYRTSSKVRPGAH